MDEPREHLAPPVNQLLTTVFAPTSVLNGADGQIRASGMQGVFVADVRVLAEAVLTFGGFEPHPLATMAEGPGRSRSVAAAREYGDPINDPTVRLDRLREVAPDGLTETIRITSSADRPVTSRVAVDLRCDLRSLEEVRTEPPGPDVPPAAGTGGLTWSTQDVTVEVIAPGAEASTGPPRLTWPVELPPHGELEVTWRVRTRHRQPMLAAPAGPVEWYRPVVVADDARLTRLLARSLDDLESLRLTEPSTQDTFLGAGAPWFLTLFGRDSIWAARMLLPLGTALAAGTLRTLARHQGTAIDPQSGEAPGKIMHELRREDVRIGRPKGTFAVYYATVDATLLWISLLAEAWRWGMPDEEVAELLPHLDRALSWLRDHADPDGDGFVKYRDVTGRGLANQGWKDSSDAVRFHDGRTAVAPIALCEVQAYAHRAALDGADLLDAFAPASGHHPDRLRAYAADLAERFRARFWVDGPLGPCPAMALDAAGQRVDALTSNIGHLLGTGLLTGDEERIVADLVAHPALSGAYGLRTMSTMDKGFAPLSYHCGSVWPHDTAITLLGLSAVGADAAAGTLITGLLAAAEAFEYRLPELYSGDARSDLARPVSYPSACRPQAWAAAGAVTVLAAALGLGVNVPRGEVWARPVAGLGAIDASGLRVAGQPFGVAAVGGDATVTGLPPGLRADRGDRR